MQQETKPTGEIVIYKSSDGPELKLNLQAETVWMSQEQIASLFGIDRSVVTKHLRNIFKTAELSQNSVSANFAHTAADGKTYKVQHYSLDAILAVGYRANSKRATQFRIWATEKLRDYLLKGYIINEKQLRESQENKLKELEQASKFIRDALEAKRLYGYEKELASIIHDYTQTWVILNRYDDGDLEVAKKTQKQAKDLTYVQAKKAVEHFKDRLMQDGFATGTFGRERENSLESLLNSLSKDKMGLEEKAASLFYAIIKNRPFVDGNKRIASLLFVVFLIENNLLYDKKGERKFNDNALIALALLVEETKPSEKQTLVKLVSNLINKK